MKKKKKENEQQQVYFGLKSFFSNCTKAKKKTKTLRLLWFAATVSLNKPELVSNALERNQNLGLFEPIRNHYNAKRLKYIAQTV